MVQIGVIIMVIWLCQIIFANLHVLINHGWEDVSITRKEYYILNLIPFSFLYVIGNLIDKESDKIK